VRLAHERPRRSPSLDMTPCSLGDMAQFGSASSRVAASMSHRENLHPPASPVDVNMSTWCPGVSQRCPAVSHTCPTRVPHVSRRVPAVSRRVPHVSHTCPAGVSMSRWCLPVSYGVSHVPHGVPPVSRRVPQVSRRCARHFPPVSRRVPPVSHRCPTGVPPCPADVSRCPEV